MRITHYIYSTLLAALVLPFIASCDNIDENERIIEIEPVLNRTVLVEEFSGQLCTNCPDGAELLETIGHRFGTDTVIVVSIHSGVNNRLGLHESNSRLVGLATDFGESLFSAYGLSSQPKAIIDRKTNALDMDVWLTNIINLGWGKTTLNLSIENLFNAEENKITVVVKGQSLEDISGRVHVWLTEDNIVAPQRLKPEDKGNEADLSDGKADGYNYNHVFNHIFRASMTPIEGVPVEYKSIDSHANIQEFTIPVDGRWNVNNMTAVVFVETTEGVIQTTKCKIISD